MTESRKKPFQRPDSALADYLQDLLSPEIGEDSKWSRPAAVSGKAPAGSHAVQQQSIAESQKSQQKRPPAQWAEPPALDPKVFTPRLQAPTVTAESNEGETAARPAPVLAEVKPPKAAPSPSAKTPTEAALPETQASTPAEPPQERESRWIGGQPEWAQKPFDCLLFTVSGLKLAVPLILLGAVHPLDRDLTPLVGRPRWFMGLLTRGDRNTRVVDTAQWVMPERYRADSRAAYGFVIRLDDSEWGLACDEVAQSFRLRPDEVKWRSEDSRRPWLAGTVKSHMCALLDVGEFARMLARAEKTRTFDLES